MPRYLVIATRDTTESCFHHFDATDDKAADEYVDELDLNFLHYSPDDCSAGKPYISSGPEIDEEG